MKQISWLLFFFTVLLSCISPSNPPNKESTLTSARAEIEQSRIKGKLDDRTLRTFTLSNGLEVLLIHGPKFNDSAASLAVGVGSLANPKEHQGLAHFLEHMLFLGTKKYPSVGEYEAYLGAHQGWSNAYTADVLTNYFFQINDEGFEGALDRFSQFFINPLFTPEYVEREVNAIHSEHQKNLMNDAWRVNRMFGLQVKPDHPARLFSTGNLATLKNTNHQVLLDFYKKYYSANQMKLVLMSKTPIDSMEKWVRSYFAEVPSNQRKELTYDANIFEGMKLPRKLSVKPVMDLKQLQLSFPTPSYEKYWKSKPAELISFLLGHEGKGSLLSLLKKKNLATGLGAHFDSSSRYMGLFETQIELTDAGLKNTDQVLACFFEYLHLLREKGLTEEFYNERKTLAMLEYSYAQHIEGGQVAAQYASKMFSHPALLIDQREGLFYEYSPEDFTYFLSFLKPENLVYTVVSDKVKTNKTEEYYGVAYKEEYVKPSSLAKVSLADKEMLAFPSPNPYVPHDLEQKLDKKTDLPFKIIDDEKTVVWFQQDHEFMLPKGQITLLLKTKYLNDTPRNKVLSLLYQYAITESLNEWNYELLTAGLGYQLARTDYGIAINLWGFSEHIPKIAQELAQRLTRINISEQRFSVLKDDMKRGIKNSRLANTYQQLTYILDYLNVKDSIHYDEYFNPQKKIDLISDIKLLDVKTYAEKIYKEVYIEGLAYGSFTESAIKDSVLAYFSALRAKPLAKEWASKEALVKLSAGQNLGYFTHTETNNNCWGSAIQFGARTPRLNALLRVGQAVLGPAYFSELRTKQQLGYIVSNRLWFNNESLGLTFLIQSPNYNPFDLAHRTDAWIETVLKKLTDMPDEEFAGYLTGVIEQLKEKYKTLFEKQTGLFQEAFDLKGQFNYKEKIIAEAKTINKKEVVELFREKLSLQNRASIAVYMTKDKKMQPEKNIDYIKQPKEFKMKSATY